MRYSASVNQDLEAGWRVYASVYMVIVCSGNCQVPNCHLVNTSTKLDLLPTGSLQISIAAHRWEPVSISDKTFYREISWSRESGSLNHRHKENVPPAKLPQTRMSSRGNVPNFSLTPIWPGYLSWAVISTISPLFKAAFDGALDQLQLIRAIEIFKTIKTLWNQ